MQVEGFSLPLSYLPPTRGKSYNTEMGNTLQQIRGLIDRGEVRISDHGYDELAEDGLLATQVVEGIALAKIVEDYPDFPKGPCVLVLQQDENGDPVHSLWGIPKGAVSPAVLITAYRPDPEKWTDDFLRRRRT